MSFNGSGTFVVNSSGQPVITGTVISSTAFNALTADLATGLSTCVTKDGQTATTVRVPFAFGINSTLTTDATSATTGSIITAGGISMQKALWVGTTSRHVGAATFDSTITTVNNATVRFGNVNLGGYYDFNSSDAAGNNLANFTMAGLTSGGTLITLNTGTTTGTATALQMNGVASGANQAEIRNTHATGDRALNITGATGSTGAYQVYFARDSSTAWIMGFKPSSSNNFIISGPAGGGPAFSLPNLTLSATTGAATFASSVTATLFTPTATGNNGLGLAAANTPALYASTTEVLRATTTTLTIADGIPLAMGTKTVAKQYGTNKTSAFGTNSISIANNGTAAIADDQHEMVVVVYNSSRALISNGAGTEILVQSAGSNFSVTQGTAGKMNIYVTGGVLTAENKTGGTVNLNAVVLAATA